MGSVRRNGDGILWPDLDGLIPEAELQRAFEHDERLDDGMLVQRDGGAVSEGELFQEELSNAVVRPDEAAPEHPRSGRDLGGLPERADGLWSIVGSRVRRHGR